MQHNERQYITIPELAKIMGLSRVAVFKKVKRGEIRAIRIGRNYAIKTSGLDQIMRKVMEPGDKENIRRAVQKVVAEYGDVLKMLKKDDAA